MSEVEIGIYKSGRKAYGFDDIAIVPSRRTRDPEDVDITWQLDAFKFGLPMLGSAMDGVISPATAIEIGRLGGLGVLNLEGLWTRYEDPLPLFDEIRGLDDDTCIEFATRTFEIKGTGQGKRFSVETKADFKARGNKSPDLMDNAALAVDLLRRRHIAPTFADSPTKLQHDNWSDLVRHFDLDNSKRTYQEAF